MSALLKRRHVAAPKSKIVRNVNLVDFKGTRRFANAGGAFCENHLAEHHL